MSSDRRIDTSITSGSQRVTTPGFGSRPPKLVYVYKVVREYEDGTLCSSGLLKKDASVYRDQDGNFLTVPTSFCLLDRERAIKMASGITDHAAESLGFHVWLAAASRVEPAGVYLMPYGHSELAAVIYREYERLLPTNPTSVTVTIPTMNNPGFVYLAHNLRLIQEVDITKASD